MKIFIVGKHASGKHAVLDACQELGMKVGHECSNIEDCLPNIYMDPNYEHYPHDDISTIFENGAYVCLTGFEESGILDGYMYYHGISYYTYDNSDVMVLTPQQLSNINKKIINDHILFVWMDNTRNNRIHRHVDDGRTYSFKELEEIEQRYDGDFVKNLYSFPNSSIIYFTDEVPERVATIISAIIKHPDLKESFVENFN